MNKYIYLFCFLLFCSNSFSFEFGPSSFNAPGINGFHHRELPKEYRDIINPGAFNDFNRNEIPFLDAESEAAIISRLLNASELNSRSFRELNEPYETTDNTTRDNCIVEGIDCPYVFYNLDDYRDWVNEENLKKIASAGRTVLFSSGILNQATSKEKYKLNLLDHDTYQRNQNQPYSNFDFIPSTRIVDAASELKKLHNQVLQYNERNKAQWNNIEENLRKYDDNIKKLAQKRQEETEHLRAKLEDIKDKAQEYDQNLDDNLRDVENRVKEQRILNPLDTDTFTVSEFLNLPPTKQKSIQLRKDLNHLESTLLEAKPTNYQAKLAKGLGLETALIGRDHLSDDPETTEKAIELGKGFLNLVLGFTPAAIAQDSYEFFSGRDLFGDRIDTTQRLISGVGLFAGIATFGVGSGIIKASTKGLIRVCSLLTDSSFVKTTKYIINKGLKGALKQVGEVFNSARKLGAKTQQGIKDLAHAFNNVVGNQVGAVGKNIDDLVKASKTFTGNPKKASQFINSMKPFKNSKFTEAGRNLTKHPKVMGYESTDVMRKTLNTEAKINEAAQSAVENIIKNGNEVRKTQGRYGKIVEYRLDNGYGARFLEETNEMIGFIEP